MSGNKITALIVVAVLHVVVGYALVTGLAYEAFKKVKEVTSAVNIEEEKPPETPPPPPPKQDQPPPPIVAPPPPISFNAPAQPQIETVSTPPPPAPVFVTPAPPPPPPPPPPAPATPGTPKSNPQSWVTTDDYPSRSLREEKQGVVGFRLDYDASGKPTSCTVTRSSGTPELDTTACSLLMRRAKFKPGTQGGQPVGSSYSSSFRWQIPKD